MNRRVFLGSLTAGLLAAPLTAEAQQAGKGRRMLAIAPTPPQAFVSPLPPDTPDTPIISVHPRGDLQAAINTAAARNPNQNHVIELDAGAVFSGHYTCPAKVGTGWVTIRSTEWQSLPAGIRVTPADAAKMAKIQKPLDNNPAALLTVLDGSQGWRFVGLESGYDPSVNGFAGRNWCYFLWWIGQGPGPHGQHIPSGPAFASRISIERCYIHGNPTSSLQQALRLSGRDMQVWDSDIREAHSSDATGPGGLGRQECQALIIDDGPGPYRVENNYLNAGGQCMFVYLGNSPGFPTVDSICPADIIIRRNTLFIPLSWKNTDSGVKDPSWDGTHYVVKQLLEFKNGRRILAEGNHFINFWGGQGQLGECFAFTGLAGPDIRFQFNRFDNVEQGWFIWHTEADHVRSPYPPYTIEDGKKKRLAVLHNLFFGSGRFMKFTTSSPTPDITPGFQDIWVEHNTQVQIGDVELKAWVYGLNMRFVRCTVQNNIFIKHRFGLAGFDGSDGFQTSAQLNFDQVFGTDRTFLKNAMIGGAQENWSSAEFTVLSNAATAGLNADGSLTATSPLKGTAVSSLDPEVNFADYGVNLRLLTSKMGPLGRR